MKFKIMALQIAILLNTQYVICGDTIEREVKRLDPYNIYLLGEKYLKESKLQLAKKYFEFAADKNSPDALNAIGDGYYTGDIYKRDIKKSLSYYQKAGKIGFLKAQFSAGCVYLKYAKSKFDIQTAIYWFDLALKNKKYNLDLALLKKYILLCKKYAIKKLTKFQ